MRGDGRVFRRKDSSVWWCAYNLRGKEFRESTSTSDEKEAGKYLRKKLKEIHADEIGARTFTTPAARRLTVHDLLEALTSDFQLRGKATKQTLSHLRRADADFGERLAVELSPEFVDRYIEERLADKTDEKGEHVPGDKPASINRVLQLVIQAYNLAVARGTLNHAPHIRKLSERGNERQGFFTEQELAAVIRHLPADLQDFTRFCAATGMRKGEASKLTWDMLHSDELHVPGDICKNRKPRVLPLAGELGKIISRRRQCARIEVNGATQMVPFVFHRDGDAAAVGCFKKSWATATRKAGVPGRLFHDLRRYAVRAMVRAGINPQIARKWSGHASDSVFQRYSILTTDDLREAFETTEKFREAEASKPAQVVSMR